MKVPVSSHTHQHLLFSLFEDYYYFIPLCIFFAYMDVNGWVGGWFGGQVGGWMYSR